MGIANGPKWQKYFLYVMVPTMAVLAIGAAIDQIYFSPEVKGIGSLQQGQCFELKYSGGAENFQRSDAVGLIDCNEPHDFQVIASYTITNKEEIGSAKNRCEEFATERVDKTHPSWDSARVEVFVPTDEGWEAGTRSVTCYLRYDKNLAGEPGEFTESLVETTLSG